MFKSIRLLAMIPLVLAPVACSNMDSSSSSASPGRTEPDQKARDPFRQVGTTPRASDLRYNPTAILVFPDIVKAAFLVRVQGGDGGVLFDPSGEVPGYCNVTAVFHGLQAGAKSFSQATFPMTSAALQYLNSSDGWSVGVGAGVVVVMSQPRGR